jgi:hypothetical protein
MSVAVSGDQRRSDHLVIGLCATCRHAREVTSARGSSFWLCQRSVNEPEKYAKYPPLPVRRCAGYEAKRDSV